MKATGFMPGDRSSGSRRYPSQNGDPAEDEHGGQDRQQVHRAGVEERAQRPEDEHEQHQLLEGVLGVAGVDLQTRDSRPAPAIGSIASDLPAVAGDRLDPGEQGHARPRPAQRRATTMRSARVSTSRSGGTRKYRMPTRLRVRTSPIGSSADE